jgi:hypothetical protein
MGVTGHRVNCPGESARTGRDRHPPARHANLETASIPTKLDFARYRHAQEVTDSMSIETVDTPAIAPQAVETACDECAGDGQLAYDLEATMWVPRSATADWPADDRIGISVLDCLQCDGTGTVRLDPGRGNRPTRSGR